MENKFPETLRFLLQQRGITYAILAEAIGVTKQAISQYTNGKTTPNYPMLIKIASYFGVSLDYLITGQNPENKILSEKLGLSEGALQILNRLNGKVYARYIDKLLCDPDFRETYFKAISNIKLALSFPSLSKLELEGGDALNVGAMLVSAATKVEAINMKKFFEGFFEREIEMEG